MNDILAEEATKQLSSLKAASILNNECFDCTLKNPQWCSVNLGLYLCLDCAGKHRQYGVTISFVRSLSLDSWNTKYINSMAQGGNHKAKEFFTKHGALKDNKVNYHDPVVLRYKAHLKALVDKAHPDTTLVQKTSPPVDALDQMLLQAKKEENREEKKEIQTVQPKATTRTVTFNNKNNSKSSYY